eukprot:54297_1
MVSDSHTTKIVTAYFVTTILIFAAITLLVLIAKLTTTTATLYKKGESEKAGIRILIYAIAAQSFFLLSILLIIGVTVQIILIDGHKLQENHMHLVDRIYYECFEEMEYGIAICDSLGHLLMIWLFVSRLTIFDNSVFALSKRLISGTYIALFVLLLSSFVIIIEIIRDDHDVYVIIMSEIVWEIGIECMCIWLLYLFCSKLYEFIQKSSMARQKTQSKQTVHNEVMICMTQKLQSSRSNTTDNAQVQNTLEPHSVTAYTLTPSPITKPTKDDNPLTAVAESVPTPANSKQIVDFVNVMNKLALLVVVAVCSSFLSLIGNVFIEIHELKTIEQHTVDIQSIWAFLLPAMDMIITSFMLFLQFPSAEGVYKNMCFQADAMFLAWCLRVHAYAVSIKREPAEKDAVDHAKPDINVHTVTTSTISSVSEATFEMSSNKSQSPSPSLRSLPQMH